MRFIFSALRVTEALSPEIQNFFVIREPFTQIPAIKIRKTG